MKAPGALAPGANRLPPVLSSAVAIAPVVPVPVPAVTVPHVVAIAVDSMPPARVVEAKLEVGQEETEGESGVEARVPVVMPLVVVVPMTVVVRMVTAADVVPGVVVSVICRCRTRNEERERGDDEAGRRETHGAGRAGTNRKSGRVAVEHVAPPRA